MSAPQQTNTTLRLPAALWDAVKTQADQEGVSANAFLVAAIRTRLDEGHPLERLVEDLARRVEQLERTR